MLRRKQNPFGVMESDSGEGSDAKSQPMEEEESSDDDGGRDWPRELGQHAEPE